MSSRSGSAGKSTVQRRRHPQGELSHPKGNLSSFEARKNDKVSPEFNTNSSGGISQETPLDAINIPRDDSHILCDAHHSNNSLSALGQLNEVNCSFIIDTGASVSIVNPRRLGKDSEVVSCNIRLNSVTGEPIHVHGSSDIRIRFGNCLVNHRAIVATIELDCILGVDFLMMNKCRLDFGDNMLHLAQFSIHLFFPRDLNCSFVVSREDRTLPPRTEVVLRVSNPLFGSEGPLVLENEANLPSEVSLCSTLCDGRHEFLTLRLRNSSDDSIRLPQGKRIASVEIAAEVMPLHTSITDLPDDDLSVSWNTFDIRDDELTNEQKHKVSDLIKEYSCIFSSSPSDMGRTELAMHSIDTQGSHPVKIPPRRLPLAKLEDARKLVKEMAEKDVVRPSKSPWAAPVVLVKKKDGSQRFCVDYRRLNELTKKDSYPLPRMDTILSSLGESRWFSTLDLQSGYWQVAMSPADKEKTAFVVDRGLWEFQVMPFGLCNAPATFERLMDRVFEDVSWQTALVYLDDIIVHGITFEEHLSNLRIVFQKLKEAGLKLSPSKCHLFRQSVKYLGHIVSKEGLAADPDKCATIREWPTPMTKTQVRSFLGLCSYYRKFVCNFSTIAKPLCELTEKARPFVWTEACQISFEGLKSHLTGPPILSFPRPDGEFILDTDASHAGIGAVLSQLRDGHERVLEFYSSSFSVPERNYCVTRQELLAVVKSIGHFHHYLYGRKFQLRTDHSSLRWLSTFKEPEGQLARWLEKLSQYDFTIEHRPGLRHGNADALSRRACIDCGHCQRLELKEHQINLTTMESVCWKTEQSADETLAFLMDCLSRGEKPDRTFIMSKGPDFKAYLEKWEHLSLRDQVLVYSKLPTVSRNTQWLIVVPENWCKRILEEIHSNKTGGHLGTAKTFKKVRQRFFWVHQYRDIDLFVRNCHICRSRSGPSRRLKGEMQKCIMGAPFERLGIDVLGPLPKSNLGNRYIVIVMDYFTKWPEGFATPDQTAETVSNGLVEQVISRYGVPYFIHSDQGRNFEANVFRNVLSRLGIEKTRTTPLHPQSDGMVERFNRTLLDYLAKFVESNQRNWDELLPLALLAYRASVHETTGYTPAQLNFGRELRLPADLLYGCPPNTTNDDEGQYLDRLIENLSSVHRTARENLKLATDRMKANYDLRANVKSFSPGDLVWFYNPVRRKGFSPKLQVDWQGPCEVLLDISPVIYRIRVPNKVNPVVVHLDRLAPYQLSAQTDNT